VTYTGHSVGVVAGMGVQFSSTELGGGGGVRSIQKFQWKERMHKLAPKKVVVISVDRDSVSSALSVLCSVVHSIILQERKNCFLCR
jgi:hypothetical protein